MNLEHLLSNEKLKKSRSLLPTDIPSSTLRFPLENLIFKPVLVFRDVAFEAFPRIR